MATIAKQILLVNTLGNVYIKVWRICILMLGCKGLKRDKTYQPSIFLLKLMPKLATERPVSRKNWTKKLHLLVIHVSPSWQGDTHRGFFCLFQKFLQHWSILPQHIIDTETKHIIRRIRKENLDTFWGFVNWTYLWYAYWLNWLLSPWIS